MKKRVLLLTILAALVFGFSPSYTQEPSNVIHPYLQNVLDNSSDNELTNVYVVLKERLNYTDLHSMTSQYSRIARRAEVVRILKEFAAVSQRDIRNYLDVLEQQNKIENAQYNWAINVISFKAVKSAVYDLATRFPNIQSIHFDKQYPNEELVDDNGITRYNDDNNLRVDALLAPQPGLTLIRAPLVWAEGDSGRGVLVGNIDTGTDWKHPDLVNNIWNNLGEDANSNGRTIIHNGTAWVFDPGDINGVDDDGNGYIDDFVGWSWTAGNNVITGSSHGTATSGIVAGYGTNGTQTGVAPGANLIILVPSGESQNWLAQQYCLDKGVDVITSSLSYKWYFNPKPNYPMFRQMTDIELAAGVVHTNSTSNDGGSTSSAPIPFNISTPGNCPGPWIHPDQTLIGGISSVIGSANVSATTDLIVSSSPYGPAAWENIQATFPTYPYPMPLAYQDYIYHATPLGMGLIKPDVAAPGNGTVSTAVGGGYQSFSGTSGATPHLAGVAALMLGVNPMLEPSDVSRIMQLTSIEKGVAGKDNRYGAGRTDAFDAFIQARNEIPVELTSFTAFPTSAGIELNWATATELNNKGFEVERSAGNSDWQVLTFIAGMGTTTEQQSYTFVDDKNNISGTSAYRLKQIDYDGTFTFSPVVFVQNDLTPAEYALHQNYPNPFNPSTSIKFSLPFESSVKIVVYNMLGEEAATVINEVRGTGHHEILWNASGLSSGIYFYNIEAKSVEGNASFSAIKKMILMR